MIVDYAKQMISTLLFMHTQNGIEVTRTVDDICKEDLSEIKTIGKLMRFCERRMIKRKLDNACPYTLYGLDPNTFITLFYEHLTIPHNGEQKCITIF